MTDREEMQAENVGKFMKDGPRLRTDYNVWIEARDPEKDLVLLGGLGSMGIGQVWVREDDRHKEYPGYNNAPHKHGAIINMGKVWRSMGYE